MRSVAVRYSAVVIVVRTTHGGRAASAFARALAGPGGAGAVVGYAVSEGARDDALDAVKVDDTVAEAGNKVSRARLLQPLDDGDVPDVRRDVRRVLDDRASASSRRWRACSLRRTPRSSIVGGKMLGIFVLGIAQFVRPLPVHRASCSTSEWGSERRRDAARRRGRGRRGHRARDAHRADRQDRTRGGRHRAALHPDPGGDRRSVLPIDDPARSGSSRSSTSRVVGWAMEGWRTVQVEGVGVSGVIGPVRSRCFGLRGRVLRVRRVANEGRAVRRIFAMAGLNLTQLFRDRSRAARHDRACRCC